MNARSLGSVLVRNAAWLLVAALALALSTACANPFAKSGATSHACADTVAKAIASPQPVKGLWNCLSPDLQNSINAYGQANGDATFADPQLAQAQIQLNFVGQQGDLVAYHIMLTPPNSGTHLSYALVIWQDSKGLVTNFDVSRGAW